MQDAQYALLQLTWTSLPHLMSSRCSLLYSRHLRHLTVISSRPQKRPNPHRSNVGGQTPSPPEVIGPKATQGTGPEAEPEAGCEDGRIEGRTKLGLLQ